MGRVSILAALTSLRVVSVRAVGQPGVFFLSGKPGAVGVDGVGAVHTDARASVRGALHQCSALTRERSDRRAGSAFRFAAPVRTASGGL